MSETKAADALTESALAGMERDALVAEVRRLRAALTPLELVQRARDAIGWRIGWAAKNGDGVAVGVFTRFTNAANDVLAYPARRALTGGAPEEAPHG